MEVLGCYNPLYPLELEEYSRTWDSAFHQYYIELGDLSRQGKNIQMGIGAIRCNMQSILWGNKQSGRGLQQSYQGLSIMERSSIGFICVGIIPVTSILWK